MCLAFGRHLFQDNQEVISNCVTLGTCPQWEGRINKKVSKKRSPVLKSVSSLVPGTYTELSLQCVHKISESTDPSSGFVTISVRVSPSGGDQALLKTWQLSLQPPLRTYEARYIKVCSHQCPLNCSRWGGGVFRYSHSHFPLFLWVPTLTPPLATLGIHSMYHFVLQTTTSGLLYAGCS